MATPFIFMEESMSFEVIHSEKKYQGKAFDVRQDQVRLPDGQMVRLDIVEHVGAVTLIPLDETGRIWFVRQYRHATGKLLLELPAGTIEPGEPPEDCAHREIREETGMACKELLKVGEFYLAPGYSTEYMYVYQATGLYPDPLPGDSDEFLSIERIPLEQAYQMAKNGEIQDAKSLVGLFLLHSATTK
jgi:ADP-ribose pyrophosphatase